ncbi:hypothetical protein TPA0908_31610 [Micromonospora sp. AKA38]|nr:hypothetical protein TPA0908_31610 [Micromonospora sp. AKA38]
MAVGSSGSDIAGSVGDAGNVRRPRTEPSATTSSTTITITPIATTTQGDEVMADPVDGVARRVRDMFLLFAGPGQPSHRHPGAASGPFGPDPRLGDLIRCTPIDDHNGSCSGRTGGQ